MMVLRCLLLVLEFGIGLELAFRGWLAVFDRISDFSVSLRIRIFDFVFKISTASERATRVLSWV